MMDNTIRARIAGVGIGLAVAITTGFMATGILQIMSVSKIFSGYADTLGIATVVLFMPALTWIVGFIIGLRLSAMRHWWSCFLLPLILTPAIYYSIGFFTFWSTPSYTASSAWIAFCLIWCVPGYCACVLGLVIRKFLALRQTPRPSSVPINNL